MGGLSWEASDADHLHLEVSRPRQLELLPRLMIALQRGKRYVDLFSMRETKHTLVPQQARNVTCVEVYGTCDGSC